MKPLARPPQELDTLALIAPEDVCRAHGIDPAQLDRALHQPAREFLARPGKAFRARLIEACYQLAGGHGHAPRGALDAIELLHGGSLIVDDIQDDAQTRRGAPALHRLIGTPRALNTGNWLYFVALAQLDALALAPEAAQALNRSAHACLMQCHEGQAMDLALRVGELRRAELPALVHFVSALKTGALMGFAAELGASVAGAERDVVTLLGSFGKLAGVALQMLDDLGSVVSERRLHKGDEDLRGQRPSWVWAWASELVDEHTYKQLLKMLSRESELSTLRERLAEDVEELGRARIREALTRALEVLTPLDAPLDALRAELTELEQSYG